MDEIKVLYAEDSSLAVVSIRRLLKPFACALTHHWTVEEAKEVYETGKFDLVILDGTTQRIAGERDDGWKWAKELWEAGQAVVVLSSSFADGYPGVPFVGKDAPDPVAQILEMYAAGELVKR